MGDQPIVVLDNGSHCLKVGYASSHLPKLVIPTMVRRSRETYPQIQCDEAEEGSFQILENKTFLIGDQQNDSEEALSVSRPVQGGSIRDWNDMQLLWDYAFKRLGANTAESSIALSLPLFTPRAEAAKILQTLFDKYQFKRVRINIDVNSVMWARGLTTAIVVNVGHSVSEIAVIDDHGILAASKRLRLGDRDVTNFFHTLLARRGYQFNKETAYESIDRLKQQQCYVACDVKLEKKLREETAAQIVPYNLPDGRVIKIDAERYMAPELLFDPSVGWLEETGLSEAVFDFLYSFDDAKRQEYQKHIIVAGGATQYPGFPDRLYQDLSSLYLHRKGIKLAEGALRIEFDTYHRHSVWHGTATAAHLLNDSATAWASLEMYKSYGADHCLTHISYPVTSSGSSAAAHVAAQEPLNPVNPGVHPWEGRSDAPPKKDAYLSVWKDKSAEDPGRIINAGLLESLKSFKFADVVAIPESTPQRSDSFTLPSTSSIKKDDLVLIDKIGRGAFGEVWRATWFGTEVAVKKVSSAANRQELINEIAIMQAVRHPHLVSLLGTVVTDDEVWLVMELLLKGTLTQFLHDTSQEIEWNTLRIMAADMARGMNCLHHQSPPILHRDLKSLNVLLGQYNAIKIADFGLGRPMAMDMTMSKVGTPHWMAPEVCAGKRYGKESDVYSFGIVLWEMAARSLPYPNHDPFQVLLAVSQGKRPEFVGAATPTPWIALCKACWDADPLKRPSFDSIVATLDKMTLPDGLVPLPGTTAPKLAAAKKTVSIPPAHASPSASPSSSTPHTPIRSPSPSPGDSPASNPRHSLKLPTTPITDWLAEIDEDLVDFAPAFEKKGYKKVPTRPFLALTDADVQNIIGSENDYALKAICMAIADLRAAGP